MLTPTTPPPPHTLTYTHTPQTSVEVGQELAVVEAMKMQNILRSPKKTTIAKVRASVGASLKVDQVILDFADA